MTLQSTGKKLNLRFHSNIHHGKISDRLKKSLLFVDESVLSNDITLSFKDGRRAYYVNFGEENFEEQF